MNKTSSLLLLTLVVAGCGGKMGEKNPVGSDLTTIRKDGKTAQETGPVKTQVQTKTEVVIKEVEKTKEAATADDRFLVITPDPQMDFNEGQKSTNKIRASFLEKDVKIELTASGLPDGATLTPSTTEKDVYHLSWTPALYTLPANKMQSKYVVKLKAVVVSGPEKFKKIVKEKEITLNLYHNQELPSDLKVVGLPSQLTAGEEPTAFTVTAKVPGLDDKAAQKPFLIVSYDEVKVTAGQSFQELDGARHVISGKTEYLGNFQWKFTRTFDTKNIPVLPQLAKDGSIMSQADGTRLRLSFKVYNGLGLSTPESLVQVKVNYEKKADAPVAGGTK